MNRTANPLPDDTNDIGPKLAELRGEGILIGGDGPLETLRPVAHVPGALARFLARRG